jgi:hypothetical protein
LNEQFLIFRTLVAEREWRQGCKTLYAIVTLSVAEGCHGRGSASLTLTAHHDNAARLALEDPKQITNTFYMF